VQPARGTSPTIDGCLLDIDGTILLDDAPIEGAIDALSSLKRAGIPFRFLTNTTRRPRAGIISRLADLGFDAREADCLTAPAVTAAWLRNRGARKLLLLVDPATQPEFAEFDLEDQDPDFVVVADLGDQWTFELLDRAFRALMAGAELVAMQRNRYWKHQGRLSLDAGPFVAALEYATEQKAHLVGKPSAELFQTAARELGLAPERIAMVGDDLDADIRGAKSAGLVAVAVQTGKYRPEAAEATRQAADAVLGSIADLPRWLGLAP
jgi:HAD superfamily hydrolase (TIGR01458 family)